MENDEGPSLMDGLFRYQGGETKFAYRVKELPCQYHTDNGVKIGDWAVLNMDGSLFTYMKNDIFLRTFMPCDGKAQAAYVDAAFEKSLPGG